MRKAEREIGDWAEILELIDRCPTIRLGIFDETYPYVVPLSFGWEERGGALVFYFHCAKEGKKFDLLQKNHAVCVEADLLNGYVRTEHSVTADYESVIAFGHAEQVFSDEAIHGIELLLRHCHADEISAQNCVYSDRVAVFRIQIDSITGKRRFPKVPREK